MKKLILGIVVIVILLSIGSFAFYKMNLSAVDRDNKEEKLVTIAPGSSMSSIASTLKKENVIKAGWAFELYAKFSGNTNLQAGTYRFSPSFDVEKIVSMLASGDVNKQVELKISIPEGSNLRDIAKTISKNTSYTEKEILEFLNSENYVNGLMAEYPLIFTQEILNKKVKYPLEGYLFPATYTYLEKQPSLEEIFKPMISKTVEIMKVYEDDMKKNNLTPHKLLTIASLIEEEATEKIDREKIASVFYNRLEIGMPLQTDPTVLYALGTHKDRVLYKDLEVDDPYNTYRNKGLTPGPIANAGKLSIDAVLHPSDTDYFYFLAAKNGEVIFTKTFEEHKKAIEKYLR